MVSRLHLASLPSTSTSTPQGLGAEAAEIVIGEHVAIDDDEIITKQYVLKMMINGEEQEETANLMDLNTLVLEGEECELPL